MIRIEIEYLLVLGSKHVVHWVQPIGQGHAVHRITTHPVSIQTALFKVATHMSHT